MDKKILVVEDNERIKQLVVLILEEEGFSVRSSSRGDEALDLAREYQPDLILMDVMMHPMNGYEACKILKQDKETKSIPIVLVSAKGQKEEKKQGLDAGADAYIVKPFEPEELVGILKRHLHQKDLKSA